MNKIGHITFFITCHLRSKTGKRVLESMGFSAISNPILLLFFKQRLSKF